MFHCVLTTVVKGDFNIDVKEIANQIFVKLNIFCETFGLSKLVTSHTCYSETHKLSIDLILRVFVFLGPRPHM